MVHRGGCHCGKVTLEVEGEIAGVISCNCSICQRRGSLLKVTGEAELATYTFNKHVIKHRFCKTCGILPFGEGVDPKGNRMAAINIRVLEGVELEKIPVQHYDGRAT